MLGTGRQARLPQHVTGGTALKHLPSILNERKKRDVEYQRQKAERETKRLKLEEERLGLLRQFLEHQRQVRDDGAEQNQM